MYILISISIGGTKDYICVSKHKKYIIEILKEMGYYWSDKQRCYIDDKNTVAGGSCTDYIIEKINLI